MDVSVIIPNYNGEQYIRECLDSLSAQRGGARILIVDNGSTDGSVRIIREEYPWAELLELDQNYGFCRAVNEGIRATDGKYVILLNNDTKAADGFISSLVEAMEADADLFSCQAQMRRMDRPDLLDGAGDFYCALGWAIARGKNAPCKKYDRPSAIFSSCAGAAIYRRSLFAETGYFDEAHFAYLEDVDIGYRARILGYRNGYAPDAVVWHKGSAATGSRYNRFKVTSAARNNLYLIYKNMPLWQILINLPFFAAGMAVKLLFFTCKGMGLAYAKGIWRGILLARKGEKVRYLPENFDHCWRIQLELWRNLRLLF